jgi:hypothetical protein
VVRQKKYKYCPELAQSDDDRRVAEWTISKIENGALSALLPLAKDQF